MNYTITKNAEFGSVEISFEGKPAQEVRDALKALKFRWHGQKKVWYGYANEEAVRAAIEGKPIKTEKPATKAPTIDKEILRREFSKAWDSPKMIDYCTNKVAAVAVLPGGEIITVDKQSIKTRFCFGESGYDYDEAQNAAAHARTSESYFKSENMKHFNEWLKDLDEARTMSGNYVLTIGTKHYTGQDEDCKLAFVESVRLSEVIDACGGSCCLDELPGKELTIRGCARRVATPEEIDIVTEAYKTAAAQHEKKVDAYLKRYGTSKVNAWTYWRDA